MADGRVQLSRKKGWRKPAGAVVVARPTAWGNPWTAAWAVDAGHADNLTEGRTVAVEQYRLWLADPGFWPAGAERRLWIRRHVSELLGKPLACWCPLDGPCHADALRSLADGGLAWEAFRQASPPLAAGFVSNQVFPQVGRGAR